MYGSQISAPDLSVVGGTLRLQMSFSMGSFSDEKLLSLKETSSLALLTDGYSHTGMLALYRSKIQKRLFFHNMSWSLIQISRGHEFPFNYKQRSPAFQFLLET